MEPIASFKVILVGNSGQGKTTLIERLKLGEFFRHFIPTLGVDVQNVIFQTNRGPVELRLWDCGGNPRWAGLHTGYYLEADGALVMTTNFSKSTGVGSTKIPYSAEGWLASVRSELPKCPMLLIQNFTDLQGAPNRDGVYQRLCQKYQAKWFQISVRDDVGIQAPFLEMVRQLMQDPKLTFLGESKFPPPQLNLPAETSAL